MARYNVTRTMDAAITVVTVYEIDKTPEEIQAALAESSYTIMHEQDENGLFDEWALAEWLLDHANEVSSDTYIDETIEVHETSTSELTEADAIS